MRKTENTGFTLIELCLVLVIIGLIVGGIMMGQSIMQSAELRKVITQVEEYRVVVRDFRDAYGAWPGDFNGADAVWGTNCATPPTDCNGNANGAVDNFDEGYRAWQHLALAGMINLPMTGTHTGNQAVLGVNIPETARAGTGISLMQWNIGMAPVYYMFGPTGTYYPNVFILGRVLTSSNTQMSGFSGLMAYGFDQKLDDGIPSSGKVTTNATNANCTSGPAPATYVTNRTHPACVIVVQVD